MLQHADRILRPDRAARPLDADAAGRSTRVELAEVHDVAADELRDPVDQCLLDRPSPAYTRAPPPHCTLTPRSLLLRRAICSRSVGVVGRLADRGYGAC